MGLDGGGKNRCQMCITQHHTGCGGGGQYVESCDPPSFSIGTLAHETGLHIAKQIAYYQFVDARYHMISKLGVLNLNIWYKFFRYKTILRYCIMSLDDRLYITLHDTAYLTSKYIRKLFNSCMHACMSNLIRYFNLKKSINARGTLQIIQMESLIIGLLTTVW